MKHAKNARAALRVPNFNVVDFYHGHQGSTKVPGWPAGSLFLIIGSLKCTAMNYRTLGRFLKKDVVRILGCAHRDQWSSQAYAQRIVENLAKRYPMTGVNVPQLADSLLPRGGDAFIVSIWTPAAQRTPAQANAVALSVGLIAERLAPDSAVMTDHM